MVRTQHLGKLFDERMFDDFQVGRPSNIKGLWLPFFHNVGLFAGGNGYVISLFVPFRRLLFLPVRVERVRGEGLGVTKVHTRDEVLPAIEAAFAQSDEVLIEECIAGREMGCGMMVAGGREYLFPITEIVSKKDFFDYQAKYTEGYSDEITPADIAPEIAEELHRMTRIAYRACRCSGVVRVDFIVTPEGKPYLIEINSIPGMSAGSIVPKQARAMGMSLGEMFDLIIADTCRK